MEFSVTHEHAFPSDEWPFAKPPKTAIYTTVRVIRDGYPILLVAHDHDGDWQVLCGTTNESEDGRVICFGCAYERDKSLGVLADLPSGWQAWRDSPDAPWERFPFEEEPSND